MRQSRLDPIPVLATIAVLMIGTAARAVTVSLSVVSVTGTNPKNATLKNVVNLNSPDDYMWFYAEAHVILPNGNNVVVGTVNTAIPKPGGSWQYTVSLGTATGTYRNYVCDAGSWYFSYNPIIFAPWGADTNTVPVAVP